MQHTIVFHIMQVLDTFGIEVMWFIIGSAAFSILIAHFGFKLADTIRYDLRDQTAKQALYVIPQLLFAASTLFMAYMSVVSAYEAGHMIAYWGVLAVFTAYLIYVFRSTQELALMWLFIPAAAAAAQTGIL